MPVIELYPDQHLMQPYPTFEHYCATKGINVREVLGCDRLYEKSSVA
jgi:hypothetical protein